MSTAAGVASAAAALQSLIELGQVGSDLLEKVGQRREPPWTSARTTSVISMLVPRAPADRWVRFTYSSGTPSEPVNLFGAVEPSYL